MPLLPYLGQRSLPPTNEKTPNVGWLTNEQFREVLETAVIEFVTAQLPKRRRKDRRGSASIEPLPDAGIDDTDELIEELPGC